jgi:FKBP-type peptidyl-prolyl cis-trans isomerase
MKAVKNSILWFAAAAFILSVAGVRAEPTTFKDDNERFAYVVGVDYGKELVVQLMADTELEPAKHDVFKQKLISGIQEALTLSREKLEEKSQQSEETLEKLEKLFAESAAEQAQFYSSYGEQIAYNGGIMVVYTTRLAVKQMALDISRYGIPFELNESFVFAGLQDGILAKSTLSEDEAKQLKDRFIQRLNEDVNARKTEWKKVALAQGQAFRDNFIKLAGAAQTPSGLIYRIEAEGEGDSVKDGGIFTVKYTGKLADGTEFDSSPLDGEPAIFKLDDVIPGWSEGIPLVKKGGKITLVVPPELGYGDATIANIPPGSTLVYDIELIEPNVTFEAQ